MIDFFLPGAQMNNKFNQSKCSNFFRKTYVIVTLSQNSILKTICRTQKYSAIDIQCTLFWYIF
jgi:hypothetical protein